MSTRTAAIVITATITLSCGGAPSTPTCASADLDCFMSHLVVQDTAGNNLQLVFVDSTTVSSLSAASVAYSTAPYLTSGPAAFSYAYGTVIEGVDIPLTDPFQLSFDDPNGCQPILAFTLSKNGKTSGHTGCFPGVRDHRTSGTIFGNIGFTASAPDGASFDLQVVPISSAGCGSIDNPAGMLNVNGTYASGAQAGQPVKVPVTIAPPPSGGSTGGGTYYYANWNCNNVSGCIAGMGHNTGSAGPFCTQSACTKWTSTYIQSARCDTSASYPIYNAPPAGTCQN